MTIRIIQSGCNIRRMGLALMGALPGCTAAISPPPTTPEVTETNAELRRLPDPARPLVVAVYGYKDETGQFKETENFATYSHAVTQGATSVLVKALHDAGGGRWFTVLERAGSGEPALERFVAAVREGGGRQ